MKVYLFIAVSYVIIFLDFSKMLLSNLLFFEIIFFVDASVRNEIDGNLIRLIY